MNIIIPSPFHVRRGQRLLQSFCGHLLCSCPASIPLISGTSPQVIIFLKAWGENGTHPHSNWFWEKHTTQCKPKSRNPLTLVGTIINLEFLGPLCEGGWLRPRRQNWETERGCTDDMPNPLHPALSEALKLSVTGGNTLLLLKPLWLAVWTSLVTCKLKSPDFVFHYM